MTLSVVIPAHGREELLVRCLRSLGPDRQETAAVEICVVDDGSGLDEGRIRTCIEPAFGGAHSQTPFLIWRAFPSPRGRSAARNEGVRATSGDIVVFHDSDMEAREGFLAAHLAAHIACPKTAVIGRIIWPRGGGFLRYIGSRGVAKLRPGDAVPPWYFVTNNASVERCDLPGDAPFDETITGWGGEDLDLGLTLARAGIGFARAQDAVSYHHVRVKLAEHLELTFAYGRDSLPVLVGKHSELRRILRLDLLDKFVWRLMVSGAVFRPTAAFAQALDFLPLPEAVYDYLTFSAYARGWKEAMREENRDTEHAMD